MARRGRVGGFSKDRIEVTAGTVALLSEGFAKPCPLVAIGAASKSGAEGDHVGERFESAVVGDGWVGSRLIDGVCVSYCRAFI